MDHQIYVGSTGAYRVTQSTFAELTGIYGEK